jgi:hypothetical protein
MINFNSVRDNFNIQKKNDCRTKGTKQKRELSLTKFKSNKQQKHELFFQNQLIDAL